MLHLPNTRYLVDDQRPMKHGTTTGYKYHGCRCDLCKKANREWYLRSKGREGEVATHLFRWPLQPLFEAAGTSEYTELAYLTGFRTRTIHRWAAAGISDNNADRAAIALGLHPYTIWPEWFDRYLEGAA